MTALCGGGASDRRPLVSDAFLITSGVAAEVIAAAGGIGYQILAAALGTFSFDLVASCPVDPPGFSALTLAESNALIQMNIGTADFNSAQQKMRDNIFTALWYVNCECVTGPQPAQPAFPSLPTGTPVLPSAGNGTCSDLKWQGTPANVVNSQFSNAPDISPQLLPFVGTPVTGHVVPLSTGRILPNLYPMPAQKPLQARMLMNVAAEASIGIGFWFGNTTCCGTDGVLSLQQNPLTQLHFDSGLRTLQTTIDCGSGPLPVTHYAVTVQNISDFFPTSQPTSIELQLFGCNAQGPICCSAPSNQLPDYSGILNQIYTLTTLIQRQAAPFGYIAGATHAGLVNQGQFNVADILGLSVSLTTLPPNYGSAVGDPTRIFDVGFVDVGTVDGFTASQRISSSGYVWFPPAMGAMTIVSYSLAPGVVATITELKHEP